ncbi:MAG: alpha/beta fold hydrolase [Xanthomonadales bacterium]|nr:alpha/beta hydrolase [Gammaproteobacteria bacterium]MBT8053677.1 alpha/beta hydrolase [Gammaproteobacteria bacterium]NND57068.1 alpha/beta fold hydrolase [Xanthomonadales bacterium]NNK51850.1 alpha/beta fold hydrolase [Xanthomonadales bacterium]NNL95873.1 alpha/beta fold hydrolase [Xanthomonadales bacterium]
MKAVTAEVILVHGLWFGSWAMARLDRNLQAQGFAVRRFSYRSTAGEIDRHSHELMDFAAQSGAQRQHFVGHSLGGLVILHMLNRPNDLAPGRVVLLGSPLDGSIIARRSERVPGGARLLGEVRNALQSGYGRLVDNRETGMIAGTRAVGLGLLLGGTGKPGDGTVAVDETRTTGLKDHLLMPVTHTSMLYSAEVARQAACFLDTGGFDWPVAC